MSSLRTFKREKYATMRKVIELGFSTFNKKNRISREGGKAGRAMGKCRTAKMGGRKYACECGEEVIIYKSCNNKSCPECNGHENNEWLKFHKERLIDTKYLHIIFVMPEELNDPLLKNKKELTNLFFKVVQKILKKRYKGMTGGIIITEHSAGSTLGNIWVLEYILEKIKVCGRKRE